MTEENIPTDEGKLTALEKLKIKKCFNLDETKLENDEIRSSYGKGLNDFFNTLWKAVKQYPIIKNDLLKRADSGKKYNVYRLVYSHDEVKSDEKMVDEPTVKFVIRREHHKVPCVNMDNNPIGLASGINQLINEERNNEIYYDTWQSPITYLAVNIYRKAEEAAWHYLRTCDNAKQLCDAFIKKYSSLIKGQQEYMGIFISNYISKSNPLFVNFIKNASEYDEYVHDIQKVHDDVRELIDMRPKNMRPMSQIDYNIIAAYEQNFKERYGMKISLMSAIQQYNLEKYNLPNSFLQELTDENLYDRKKWQKDREYFILDLARFPCDEKELTHKLYSDGLKFSTLTCKHVNKTFSTVISVWEKQLEEMFKKVEQAYIPQKNEPFIGKSFTFDVENPPILCLGDANNILPLKNVLTSDMKKHLESGEVLYVGRSVDEQPLKPAEVLEKPYKKYDCQDFNMYASRLHGYITVTDDGKYCYTDCSYNGTFVKSVKTNDNMVDLMLQKTIRKR